MSEGSVKVSVFGKQNCAKCSTTKRKLSHFLSKWQFDHAVNMIFYDLDTVDGRAEGMFYDVYDAVPVTIIETRGRSVARWEGRVPNSQEVRLCLDSVTHAAAG